MTTYKIVTIIKVTAISQIHGAKLISLLQFLPSAISQFFKKSCKYFLLIKYVVFIICTM